MGVNVFNKRGCRSKPLLGSSVDWSHPLARGLVGVWLLNEGAGSVLLNPVSGVSGIRQSAPWATGPLTGPALAFDGSTSWFDGGSYASIDNLTQLSVVFWMFVTDDEVSQSILDKGLLADQSGWKIMVNGALASIRFIRRFDTIPLVHDQNIFAQSFANRWVQVVVTHNGGQVATDDAKIYFDGIVGSETGSPTNGVGSTVDDSSLSLRVGKSQLNDQFLDGSLDHVLLYNRPLSPLEVQALYVDPFAFTRGPVLRAQFQVTQVFTTRVFGLASSVSVLGQGVSGLGASVNIGSRLDSSDLPSSVDTVSGDGQVAMCDVVSESVEAGR